METKKLINVLFLCTHNSARSILAEAILNHLGKDKFKAYSAGSSPRNNQQPNPYAIKLLQSLGITVEGLSSKSWDEFAKPDAVKMDLIITVCDDAAGEACPYWPGQPATAHWGFTDPSSTTGSDEDIYNAFRATFDLIKNRIELFVGLSDEKLDVSHIENSARELGKQ
jgi:protein-tyrosine-phosphatase